MINIIIPVRNEEKSIGKVLDEIPKKYIKNVIVISNGSTDNTSKIAKDKGVILLETTSGYGKACLKGIEYCKKLNPNIIVFMDGKYTDNPLEIDNFIKEIEKGYDFVVGTRVKEKHKYKHQEAGNKLAVSLMNLFWGFKYTDLGPFRAIKFNKLLELEMNDQNFGWTVEMQIKAIKHKLKIKEIPVSKRDRIGRSQISGTIKGTIKAGSKILLVIFKELITR